VFLNFDDRMLRKNMLSMVVHIYNPSYSGDGGKRIEVRNQCVRGAKAQDLI
jgi:hypothetical protein